MKAKRGDDLYLVVETGLPYTVNPCSAHPLRLTVHAACNRSHWYVSPLPPCLNHFRGMHTLVIFQRNCTCMFETQGKLLAWKQIGL